MLSQHHSTFIYTTVLNFTPIGKCGNSCILRVVKAPVIATCCFYLSRLKTGVCKSEGLLLSSLYLNTQHMEAD